MIDKHLMVRNFFANPIWLLMFKVMIAMGIDAVNFVSCSKNLVRIPYNTPMEVNGQVQKTHRTFVKICGITNREDANFAINCGADALGFIGVQESPRFISVMAFNRIRDVIPASIPLFVVVRRMMDGVKYGANVIQYYEPSTSDADKPANTKTVQVTRVREADDIDTVKNPPEYVDASLLDAVHASILGGSGTKFDWTLAIGLRAAVPKPFFLAGGLTPSNVVDALNVVKPFGVDVSSGVEDKTPGAKDHKLVEGFITNVRNWDNSLREIKPTQALSLFDILAISKY